MTPIRARSEADPLPMTPVAVWRCSRCGYDLVEYSGAELSEPPLCEDICRGPAYSFPYPNPRVDRQLERILVVPVEEVERAADLAERYGEALIAIGAALVADDLNPRGRIMRARGVIAGLEEGVRVAS